MADWKLKSMYGNINKFRRYVKCWFESSNSWYVQLPIEFAPTRVSPLHSPSSTTSHSQSSYHAWYRHCRCHCTTSLLSSLTRRHISFCHANACCIIYCSINQSNSVSSILTECDWCIACTTVLPRHITASQPVAHCMNVNCTLFRCLLSAAKRHAYHKN